MTNWEKWKAGLTAEMFANIQVVDRDAFLEWANAEYKETRLGHLFEQLRRLAYDQAYLLPTSRQNRNRAGDSGEGSGGHDRQERMELKREAPGR